MATFVELCQAVRQQASISGEGPTSVTGQTGIYADIVRWVEEAYNEIQTLHDNWNFLFTPVNFTLQQYFSSYPLASAENVRQIAKDSITIQFQLGKKEKLRYVPYFVWRNSDRFTDGKNGKPQYVTQNPSGDLLFYPSPDADYDIEMDAYSRPHVMVANDDEPIFHSQYHDAIKTLALMKYAEYYNAMEIYKTANITYNNIIARMRYSELPRDNLATPTLVPFA